MLFAHVLSSIGSNQRWSIGPNIKTKKKFFFFHLTQKFVRKKMVHRPLFDRNWLAMLHNKLTLPVNAIPYHKHSGIKSSVFLLKNQKFDVLHQTASIITYDMVTTGAYVYDIVSRDGCLNSSIKKTCSAALIR